MSPVVIALIALAAGFLLGRLTARPLAVRPPGWAAARHGDRDLIYWTAPVARRERYFVVLDPSSVPADVAADLNRRGVVPADVDLLLAAASTGGAR